jgi:hypothetical protein
LGGAPARASAPPAADGPGPAVAVVAPTGTSLADEIGRELRASHFDVVRVYVARLSPAAGRSPPDSALGAVPLGLARGVLISPDERRVTIFERVGATGEVFTDLRIDPQDVQVRRHACFAVVEYLRVMTLGSKTAGPAESAAEAPTGPRAQAGAPGDPPGAAVAAVEAASPGLPVLHQRPWTLGVAAKLDLDTGLGASTTDLQFVWHFRIGRHLGIRAMMVWPLVGATITSADTSVRLWNFGTGVGLHYAFAALPAPVRPFVGVGLGTRLTLTQTFAPATPEVDGRTVLTPSLNVGLEVGLACRVARFAELFFDAGATRDRLVPGLARYGVEASAASALSLNSAIGVMFEY